MKKLLLIALILLFSPQSFAFEDYLIFSDKPVSSIFCDNEEVLTAKPFFTIDNKKDTILVNIKKEGEAVITIDTKDGFSDIDVKVTTDDVKFSEKEGFTYMILDVPSGKEAK